MAHRLVLDTNVVVSAIINIGYPNKIVRELVATEKVVLLLFINPEYQGVRILTPRDYWETYWE